MYSSLCRILHGHSIDPGSLSDHRSQHHQHPPAVQLHSTTTMTTKTADSENSRFIPPARGFVRLFNGVRRDKQSLESRTKSISLIILLVQHRDHDLRAVMWTVSGEKTRQKVMVKTAHCRELPRFFQENCNRGRTEGGSMVVAILLFDITL